MRNPGFIVEHTITLRKGRTFHSKETINGKTVVYYEDPDELSGYSKVGALVNPHSLKVIGFID